MLDVVEKLNMESRRAVFGAVVEAQSGAVPDVTPELIARCLLRTPSVRDLSKRSGVDEAALVEALGSSVGSLEKREAVNAFESAQSSQGVGIVMAMSARAENAMKALATQLAGEEFESVAPVRVLRELLICDQHLRDLCSRFGLSIAAFPSEGS